MKKTKLVCIASRESSFVVGKTYPVITARHDEQGTKFTLVNEHETTTKVPLEGCLWRFAILDDDANNMLELVKRQMDDLAKLCDKLIAEKKELKTQLELSVLESRINRVVVESNEQYYINTINQLQEDLDKQAKKQAKLVKDLFFGK